MKRSLATLTLLAWTGCALGPRTDPLSLQRYTDISICADESSKNPIRANCGERFKDTELSGELQSFELSGDSPNLSLLLEGQSFVHCRLEGRQDRQLLAELDPGDRLTVRGTPTDRSRTYLRYGTWETITFTPCTLLKVHKVTASR